MRIYHQAAGVPAREEFACPKWKVCCSQERKEVVDVRDVLRVIGNSADPSLTSCVTLGKLSNLSGLLHPPWYKGQLTMLPFSGVGAAGQVHTRSALISPGPLLGLVLREHSGFGEDSRQR